jgi:CBS domain-containing protein
MHPGIVSCSQAATPSEIARIMVTCRVHCVAVMGVSAGGREDPVIWGIVSDLDLLQAATGQSTETSAAALAHQPVVSIRPTKSVSEAAQAMVTYRTPHLIVVDPDRLVPLGVVSSLDIAEALARRDLASSAH